MSNLWINWRFGIRHLQIGDEAEISLDLCQKCIKTRLGDVLEIGPDWSGEYDLQ